MDALAERAEGGSVMRVILDIDERFSGVISVTAIKSHVLETCVTSTCVDLKDGQYLSLDNNGHWDQMQAAPKED